MKQQKEIVTLILSLTPRERRFFKKTYDSDNEFVKLFDYIIKHKSFSVSEFNQYLAKSEKRTTLYSSGYISTIRQYLRVKLLESLRKIHRNANPTMELWNDLGVSQILMNKGLIDIAKNELNPSFEAKDRLFPLESLALLQQQSIFQFAKGYKDSTEESVNALYSERRRQTKQHLIEIELARSISLLSFYLQKNIYVEDKIKAIEDSEVMKSDYKSLCFINKYLLDWAHAQLSLLKNDIGNAYYKFYKVINLWLLNPEMIRVYPDIFIGCCQYYLKFTQYKSSGNFKKEELNFINKVLTSFKKAALELGISERVEKFIAYFELNLDVIQGDFHKAIEKEPTVSQWILNSTDISQFSKNYMNFLWAYAAFHEDKFELCLNKTETIIFNKENIAESPLYFAKATILYLMGHFSAGNKVFVQNEFKKRERSLKKAGLISEFEELFFKFLHNFFLKRNSDKKLELSQEFQSKFSALADTNQSKHSYRNRMVVHWLERIIASEKAKI